MLSTDPATSVPGIPFGERDHVKQLEADAARILARLEQAGELPDTSQVPPLAWMEKASPDDPDF